MDTWAPPARFRWAPGRVAEASCRKRYGTGSALGGSRNGESRCSQEPKQPLHAVSEPGAAVGSEVSALRASIREACPAAMC